MARAPGEGRVKITPSEVHTYVYCPRLYFFELYLGRERGMLEKLRLLLGRIYHALHGFTDRLAGRRVEEPIEVELGSVIVRGRPDAFTVSREGIVVVERKSSRPPRRGAWASDGAQAMLYAFMLSVIYGASSAEARVEYPGVSRSAKLDTERVTLLTRILDEIMLVKKYGIVPAALRSPRKCSRCPFNELCTGMDAGTSGLDLYEPGAWLHGRVVDEGFQEPSR